MRPLLFAANWKMQVTPEETRRFAAQFRGATGPVEGRSLWFFPSAVSITTAAEAFRGRADIHVGAQDVHWEPKGAFTGATSIPLARGAGASGALVGHSERRHVFGESDEETGKKVRALLDAGCLAFLCVGEQLAEREAGKTTEVVLRQLRAGLAGVSGAAMRRLVIAYEPVWAIGTGRTATAEDAAAVHAELRAELSGLGATERVSILYGGSVNLANAAGLLAEAEIDGVLVGGASLDPAGWAALVESGG